MILAFLLLSSVTAIAQADIEGLYKIYDTKTRKEATIADIVKAFENADVLFFGEEHDDSIGHILEARILEQSYKKMGDKLVLSMEMFERDVQLVVDEYLAGLIQEKNLIEEGRAWKNYSDYRPLVELAKANKLKVIAANTPRRYTNAVTHNGMGVLGSFDNRARPWLPPLPVDTATGKYYDNFLKIMDGHGEMPGLHIYQSQNVWDATMAWSIHSYLQSASWAKVYHLNGRFHTDEKLGIIAQLKKYAAKQNKQYRILNISSFYLKDISSPDWEKYKGLGDFIIVTRKVKEIKE